MYFKAMLPMMVATAVSAVTLQDALNSQSTTLSTLNDLLSKQPDLLQTLNTAQNITLLAPSNGAFNTYLATEDGKTAAADPSAIAGLLQYHVLNSNVPASGFTETMQFLPTLMTDARFTNVTGGQVVEGVIKSKKVEIYSGLKEKSTVQTADITFDGGTIHIIDKVLTIPLNAGFTAIDSNLTALAGALQRTQLVDTVNNLKDATIFAPSNEAFRAIGSAVVSLSTTDLSSILTYHVIAGTVAFSPLILQGLANNSVPTVNGAEVTLLVENKKVFVNSAQVISTDIIIANGVMHVLNNVINPANESILPDAAAKTQAVAYPGASQAPDVPFTAGIVPSTTAPSASLSTNGAVSGRQGSVGAAALFGVGVGVVGMAVL